MRKGGASGEVYSNGLWSNQSIYISLTNGSDAYSGHKSTVYTINGGVAKTGSYTITTAGENIIKVITTDNAGNTATRKYTVKIDKKVPTVGKIKMRKGSASGEVYDGSTWTNEDVYISLINGSDTLSGHKSTVYSIDGGTSQTANTSISTSGEHSIKVTTTDKAGNISTTTYTAKIDKTKPVLNITNSTNGSWTKNSVTIKASASDTASGIQKIQYKSGENGEWTDWSTGTSASKTLSEKHYGKFYVRAIDNAGNIATANTTVYIDSIAPTIKSITKSTEGWTNEAVILTINAEDTLSINGKKYNGVGLADEPYSFDGGKNWTSDNTKKYENNTNGIVIKVRDKLGNIYTHKTINITNIDKIKPSGQISASAEATNEEEVTIYVSAEDTGGAGIGSIGINGWYGTKWVSTHTEGIVNYDSKNDRYYATFSISDIRNTTTGETNQGEGRYTFHAHLFDKAGNHTITKGIPLIYDTTKPTGKTTASVEATSESTVTIYVSAEDVDGSGIEKVAINGWYGTKWISTHTAGNVGFDSTNNRYYATFSFDNIKDTTTGETNNGDGKYTFHAHIYDKAGNNIITNGVRVLYDTVNPNVGTITMKLGNSNGDNYINNTFTSENVYLELNNGSDSGSGHKSTVYSVNGATETTESQILRESGTYEIVVKTTDNAGNISTNSYIVKIRKVENLLITRDPKKVEYNAYENFDKDGMGISVKYDNGDIEEIKEYTVVNGENLTCKVTKIEIRYNGDPDIKVELPISVAHDIQEATCTEIGKCRIEGCTYTQEALGHNLTNYVSNNDATCTQDGTKTAKCERCDVTDTVTDEGSKKSHTEEIDARVEPTCTKTGLTEGKHCQVCQTVIVKQQKIAASGHNYEEQVINSTCTEKGYTKHQCTRCEHSYVDKYTDALEHSFRNYVSNNDATCTKDGTKTAKCERCDVTDTVADEGSKKSHTEEIDVRVEPTCTKTGLTEGKHCQVCQTVIVKQQKIEALGHNYEEQVINSTCTEKGYTKHQCTRCEHSYVDKYTDALEHSFRNYVSNNDATCTKDGTKTAKCDRCDVTDTVIEKGRRGPHNYKNGICIECGEAEPKLQITSERYGINELYITKIQIKTTIKEFKENIETNATEINIYNKQNEKQEEAETLATGMTVEFKYGNETKTYVIVVAGDVNGDGKIKLTDMSMVNRHRLNKTKLEGAYLLAGDVTRDGKVSFMDLVKINRRRLNKIAEL